MKKMKHCEYGPRFLPPSTLLRLNVSASLSAHIVVCLPFIQKDIYSFGNPVISKEHLLQITHLFLGPLSQKARLLYLLPPLSII
jgi:hypothetical protein